MVNKKYTTQLGAGLGLIEETKLLLSIYEPGMTVSEIHEVSQNSGLFPLVSSRRLRNMIAECFSPRYLKTGVASSLKKIAPHIPAPALSQIFLIFTAEANPVLHDFIIEIFWGKYAAGRDTISHSDSSDFIDHAIREGKTQTIWSESMAKRVSSYLIGCCADYGLVSATRSANRQIQVIRIHEYTVLFNSYWLHFLGVGDNSIIHHASWKLFGLEPNDVREELKRMSKNGWLIFQSAGTVTSISWSYHAFEEVVNVIIEG